MDISPKPTIFATQNICTNRTLQELVELRPTTRQALRSVYGMGLKTIERYGDALLEEVRSKEIED